MYPRFLQKRITWEQTFRWACLWLSTLCVQALENDYYTLAGRLIGERESGVTVFLLTDELGSVLTSLSAVAGSAAVTSTQVYSPYGSPRYRKGTVPTPKGFTGQYHDVSGLDYYHARYYDPVVGRFVSADIKQGNAQGMDPYSYVGNNPETLNDPTGRMPCAGPKGPCGFPSPSGGGGNNGGGGNKPGNKGNPPSCAGDPNIPACYKYEAWKERMRSRREDALRGQVLKALGFLALGAIIVIIGDVYLFKHRLEDFEIPEMVGVLLDMLNLLVEVGHVVGELASFLSPVVTTVEASVHVMLAVAHFMQAVADAAGSAWYLIKASLAASSKILSVAAGGLPGELLDIGLTLAGNTVANLVVSGGHVLMAEGDGLLAQTQAQNAMDIGDWCAQYGSGVCDPAPKIG
ncbi:MAG: RHS repeat-associated core domain-containing protein [Ktedonobacteraceae bacterium]|nr:RHS repeat-associated core domain-containing protein [Ktedonobacteraceae bacterium]